VTPISLEVEISNRRAPAKRRGHAGPFCVTNRASESKTSQPDRRGSPKPSAPSVEITRPIEEACGTLLPPSQVAVLLNISTVSFLSVRDFLLLRIEFRTKRPWPFKAFGLRVIGPRTDVYIVAGLALSHRSTLQVDGRMRSRRTSEVGARGKCQRENHWNHKE
jgi:hypothetical protein